jgi:sulfite exporter TauE/SafE
MLALAMSTGSVLAGGALMVVFGVGTAPGMVLVGMGGRLMGIALRRRLLIAAAWCLVLTGVISMARGMSYLAASDKSPGSCPLCTQRS